MGWGSQTKMGVGIRDKNKCKKSRTQLELTNKILEVHETTRKNGHGLGMWIVNNTIQMSGGKIKEIKGDSGFSITFSLGGKL